MDERVYEEKLEAKLIKEFSDKFYEKMGYYPTVITKKVSNQEAVILTLPELESYFQEYLPTVFGKKLPLANKNRCRELVELRCIFFFIGRCMHYSLKPMGKYLNGRDHTTVLHGIRTFKNLYDTDPNFKKRYYEIINKIKADYEPSVVEHVDQMEFEP